jgi:hypothetical protein
VFESREKTEKKSLICARFKRKKKLGEEEEEKKRMNVAPASNTSSTA